MNKKPSQPTLSQRLRIALLALHTRGKYKEDFEDFYKNRMEKIIKWVNRKPK